jgi:uncharacterized paraquat-inducible protein A
MMLGMVFLWPILLLLFLALPAGLALGGYVLYRRSGQIGSLVPAATETAAKGYTRACPSCGRFLREDWISCPYCGAEISQDRR